jgi:dolichol kinase
MRLSRHREGIIARKLIHYSAASIPLGYYYFLDKTLAIYLLLAASFVVVFSDVLRMVGPRSRRLYWKLFGWMTKRRELNQEFTGASYMLVGSLVAVMIFPKAIAVIALLFLTIGDPSACLVGVFMGRIRTFDKKTLEGTLAFIMSGFIVTLLVIEIPLSYKLLAAIVAGIIEMLPIKIDDNFTIPLSAGLTLLLLTSYF